MDGTITFWQSKTIWGLLVSVLAGGLGLLGYTIPAADQSAIVGIIIIAVGLASNLYSIWARIAATKQIVTGGKS